MIDYIFDAIKAKAGEDIEVSAFITDEEDNFVTAGCSFVLYGKDGDKFYECEGTCSENMTCFVIPAEETKGLKGRYWYTINEDGKTMNFFKPFYLE